jgi:hypothetical protein
MRSAPKQFPLLVEAEFLAVVEEPPHPSCFDPDEVGLKRLSRFWARGGDVSHFDEVLKFASSKGLPPRSLEDIAGDVRRTLPANDHVTQVMRAAGGP